MLATEIGAEHTLQIVANQSQNQGIQDEPVMIQAEPWKRRLDESGAAYAAFRCFLELGVGRTAREAYRQFLGKPEASQTPGSWNEWIKRFEWSQRAIAWDNRVVTVHQEALESAVAKRAIDWVERDHQFREARYQTARRLMASAETVSKFPVTAESVERDGKTTKIEPVGVDDLRKATAIAREAAELGCVAISEALELSRSKPSEPPVSSLDAKDRANQQLESWRAEQRAKILAIPAVPPA